MYLLIDAGNSRLKFACHDGQDWLVRHSADTPEDLLRGLPEGFRPHKILISCVAGATLAGQLRQALDGFAVPVEFLQSSPHCCGVRNGYRIPAHLGTDRWAAAIGAWHLLGSDCLLICAGTATTIDIVRSPGEFAGGSILPGLSLMLDALAARTAALPRASAELAADQLARIPADTLEAISAGCLHAQLGAIGRMRALMPAGAPVLISGGNAGALIPHLEGQVQHRPWLVTEGLLVIARTALSEAPENKISC